MQRNKDIGDTETSPALPVSSGHTYFLGIAIDEYARPLSNCVRDMHAAHAALQAYRGFGAEYATLLVNEKATRRAVLEKLRELNQVLTGQDNLLLYFSGHGALDPVEKEGYWLLYGCDFSNYWQEGLTNQDLIRLMRNMKAQHIVVLADSCFSGTLFYTHRSEGPGHQPEAIERFRSRWAITSGRSEVVSDGTEGGHSPFAAKLLEFLQRNDHPQGRFSVSELSRFLKNAVPRNSTQSPDGRPLHGVGDDGGEFVFYCPGSAFPPPAAPVLMESTTSTNTAPVVSLVVEAAVPAEAIAQIRGLIGRANLDDALKLLMQYRPEALQTQQMWAAAKREHRLGLISNSEWSLRRNQISMAILDYLKPDG